VSLYLVRHASAIARSRWPDDDLDRPLDERGRAQVAAITAFFAVREITTVRSSRAVRCVETVQGVADARGLTVDRRDELTEGARPSAMVELIRTDAAAGTPAVLCSHGDLIPEALNRLMRDGMRVIGPRGCEKGSIWELEVADGAIARGTYTSAP
jgi:8-oxo-dGTP diphosphatase